MHADERKLFTKLVDLDDKNSSIESDWEDDNDVSDSDSNSQDVHQTMCNLFSHSLQRHLRSKFATAKTLVPQCLDMADTHNLVLTAFPLDYSSGISKPATPPVDF